ncbi:MAG: LacI family DNA-binding transcriptional regulator [Sphaerochaetaceae bacterium]
MADKITQRDVARLAKVSTGTVSRVINKHPMVSPEAELAVLQAIEKLGYTPNMVAQSLAQGRTRNILVVFLDISPILPSTWQYELPILQGINDYLTSQDYALQIGMHTLNSNGPQALFKDILHNKSIDGLIILTSWALDGDFIRALYERGIPVAFIGNGPYLVDGVPVGTTILFDNYQIIQEAYRLLHSLGHRRIAFVTGSDAQLHAQLRLQAFTDVAKEYHEEFSQDYIHHGDYSVNSGFEALYAFYKTPQPPTAIICANDLMAIGAMKAANEFGLRIPQDISIIGFDNIEVSSFYSPPLTSVKVPAYDLGTLGAQKLLESIQGNTSCETLTLPTKLLVRKSVCRLETLS